MPTIDKSFALSEVQRQLAISQKDALEEKSPYLSSSGRSGSRVLTTLPPSDCECRETPAPTASPRSRSDPVDYDQSDRHRPKAPLPPCGSIAQPVIHMAGNGARAARAGQCRLLKRILAPTDVGVICLV
jgi:hypothetical protein